MGKMCVGCRIGGLGLANVGPGYVTDYLTSAASQHGLA
jgi:hypothetical protein